MQDQAACCAMLPHADICYMDIVNVLYLKDIVFDTFDLIPAG